jgi:hypothetical protein
MRVGWTGDGVDRNVQSCQLRHVSNTIRIINKKKYWCCLAAPSLERDLRANAGRLAGREDQGRVSERAQDDFSFWAEA